MPGQTLVMEVVKRRPGMKVLMVSGLADGLDTDALRELGVGWVLQKPHSHAELDAIVHEALEA